MVAYDTPLEILEQLKRKLEDFINDDKRRREWANVTVNIDKMDYQNAIHLTIGMEHRPNWQDWGGRWARRTAFMRNLKQVLEDLDVRYLEPIQPVVLPRGAGLGSASLPSPRLDAPPSPRSGGGARRAHSTRETREMLGNAGYLEVDAQARSPSRSLRPGGDTF